MRPKGHEEEVKITITILEEFYLRYREDPVRVNVTYEIPVNLLEEGDEVADVMSVALSQLLSTIDVVREHRIIRSDGHNNKFVFLTDEVQGVSILAPTEETVMKAIEEAS